MNRETLQARVLLLQQNVEIQSQQVTSLVDNLKVLQGHLAESKHWLEQLGDEPTPDVLPPIDGEPCEPVSSDNLEPCEQE